MSHARQALTPAQEPFLPVCSLAAGYSSGFVMAPHAHDWRQLLYATSGAMTVTAGRWCWMILPGNAVFLPAGCRHSMRMWGDVAMRTLYFPGELDAAALRITECRALAVRPLLR